jgi:hypothetical protein
MKYKGGTTNDWIDSIIGNYQIEGLLHLEMSLDSSIVIAMGYGLDSRGLIPDWSKILFCTPKSPDRLWRPPNLLYSGYWGAHSARSKAAGS